VIVDETQNQLSNWHPFEVTRGITGAFIISTELLRKQAVARTFRQVIFHGEITKARGHVEAPITTFQREVRAIP
jgi:hypothetical protein